MTLLYKPIGLALALIAAMIGRKAFDVVWTKIADEEPPEATTRQADWPKILVVAVIQGAIFKFIRVIVDRFGAKAWKYLTGTWPGEEVPDPEK